MNGNTGVRSAKPFSEKTQGGSSNHWGYLVTTTAQLRACALSIKSLVSMVSRLSQKLGACSPSIRPPVSI